jgi:MFS family permease
VSTPDLPPAPPPGPSELRRLSALIATCAIDTLGFAVILPLLPFYALELHAQPVVIGLIISSFSLAQLVSAPLWGHVSDRYGRRPALLIGLTGSCLAYVVFAFASNLWLLFASRIIQGAGGGTTGVAQAYVGDSVEPAGRARALGWLSSATSVGIMIGPAIGSLAARGGRAVPGLVAAALCAANIAFAWRWLPESRPARGAGPHAPASQSLWRSAAGILLHPGSVVARLVWVYAVGMLAFTSLTAVLPLYLGATFGFTASTIGYVFLYVGLLSLVMRSVCLGPIVKRIGETWAMRAGAGFLAAGFFAYPLAHSLWGLAAVVPLVPVGTALLFPSTTALMSRASDPRALGATMGIAQTFAGVSRLVAPILATAAYQHLGHAMPFYLAGTIVLAAATAIASLARRGAAPEP